MLDELKPDIAFILCENVKKPEIVEKCAKRHINVCIEKPMAVDLESALKIRNTVNHYGIEAIVNWPVIWRPHNHIQLAALESGLVGDLVKVFYINGHTGPLGKGAKHRGVMEKIGDLTDEQRASTWWYRKESGGGTFLDIGCYGCLFNQWARKEGESPDYVTAFGKNYCTPYMNCEDNIVGVLEYKDSFGVIEGTWTTPQIILPTGPVYCCTNGAIYSTPDRQVKAVDIYGDEIKLPVYEITPHIENIADHYAYCKKNNLPLIRAITLDFNVQVMAILDAAMKSAESGRKEEVICTK